MGVEPDVVGSAATATGDDIVAVGLFTLTGGSAAADSTVIGQRRGRGLRISRSAGIGAHAAADPVEGGQRGAVIAVSSFRVYLLLAVARRQRLVLGHTFDRRRVAMTIHARRDRFPHGDPRGHLERRPLRARGRTLAPGPRHWRRCGPCRTSTRSPAATTPHPRPSLKRATPGLLAPKLQVESRWVEIRSRNVARDRPRRRSSARPLYMLSGRGAGGGPTT